MTDWGGVSAPPLFMEADMAEVVFVGNPTDQKLSADKAPKAEPNPAKKAKKAK